MFSGNKSTRPIEITFTFSFPEIQCIRVFFLDMCTWRGRIRRTAWTGDRSSYLERQNWQENCWKQGTGPPTWRGRTGRRTAWPGARSSYLERQNWQENCLTSLCTDSLCFLRLLAVLKVCLHCSQGWGRSPVWSMMWRSEQQGTYCSYILHLRTQFPICINSDHWLVEEDVYRFKHKLRDSTD